MTCILISHTCVLNLFPVLGSSGGLLCRTLRFCKERFLASRRTDWLRDTVARRQCQQSCSILYLFLPLCVFPLDICGYAVCSSDIYVHHSNTFLCCFVAMLKCMSIGNVKNFRWISERKGATSYALSMCGSCFV